MSLPRGERPAGLSDVRGRPRTKLPRRTPTWTTLAEWSDRCREREGLVVIPHFPNPFCEVAADIVLGKVDAAEIRYFTPALDGYNVREWYRFLNLGYRVAVVGAPTRCGRGCPWAACAPMRSLGTGVHLRHWAKAVRAGCTFTTSGPLIGMTVEGQTPGGGAIAPRRRWRHAGGRGLGAVGAAVR